MKTKGALLGTMSGSIGGATASRNRGGQYFRQRVVPTNPNSAKQQAVRAIFAGLVNAWVNTLTQAQRDAWATYATNVPRTNTLGDQLVLTGQQMYIGANTARVQAGLSSVAAAPTTFDRGENVTVVSDQASTSPPQIGISAGALDLVATFSAAASDDGDTLIFIGAPQNASINFFKGPYQFATAGSFSATDTDITFTDNVADLPITDTIAAGQNRPIRVVNVFDDGRYSTAFEAILPVVDTTP
jgi:hypothetical protein